MKTDTGRGRQEEEYCSEMLMKLSVLQDSFVGDQIQLLQKAGPWSNGCKYDDD